MQAEEGDAMKENISFKMHDLIPTLISIRNTIHQKPELSGEEHETTKLIRETLSQNGIESEVIADGTGLCALIEGAGKGRTVAYRADIDALPVQEDTGLVFRSKTPNRMHACGHDIHTVVLLGTGIMLQRMRAELNGSVKLIFQSGEENFSGARKAIKKGVLRNPDVDCILAMHTWPDLPAGTIGLKKGPMMASSSSVQFAVEGRGGHSAHPHKAIDPVIISAYIMTALQSIVSRNVAPLDPSVITFGKLAAGTVSNVIPNEATAEGTVRTLSVETDRLIEERIRALVSLQAESFGAKAKVSYEPICPPVINDGRIIDILEQSAAASIGDENVRWLESPSMGSEDFANYLAHVPGALVRLGTGNETPESHLPLHNSKIVFDEQSIETGVRFMMQAIVQLLNCPKR